MQEKNNFLLSKFIKSFLIALTIFMALSAVTVFGFLYISKDTKLNGNSMKSSLKGDSIGESIANLFTTVKENVNFVVMATDEAGTRTDAMVVGSFNTKTNAIDLISIPRDTYVVMPKERRDILKEEGIWAPNDGVMKLNEVHHYAGANHRVEFSVKQIEELLNIEIEYYAKVNLEAFRYIVDSIGGVEFDVPIKMKYSDPIQDLYIDLMPGLQVLYGEDAEGLLRYRQDNYGGGYRDGDITRLKVQQDFLKELINKVTSKEDILKNATTLLSTYLNYVDTNFNVSDLTKYLSYATKVDMENVNTYTLPGVPQYISGKSFWIMNETESMELIDSIFYNNTNLREENSFGKRIVVLNGTTKNGIAGSNRDMLVEKGYTVQSIGDYSGEKKNYTRIIVRTRGQGKDLQSLYDGSQIIVDPNLDTNIDIQIILGIE